MSRKLDEIFNVEETKKLNRALENMNKQIAENSEEPVEIQDPEMAKEVKEIQTLEVELATIKNSEDHENDMDEIAEKAMEAFDRLMEIAEDVDERNSGKIYEAAVHMMKNAIDAKNSKVTTKLKGIEILLKKQKMEKSGEKDPASNADMGETKDADFIIASRGDILKQLKSQD